jgi:hypothetical protein
MKKILFPLLFCATIVALSTLFDSCYFNNEQDLYKITPTICDTTNAKFAAFVSPLIANGCATASCHSTTRQAAGINLGTYTTIKAYITADKASFLGSIDQAPGYSAMPKGGSKFAPCDITKLKTWINAGMQNN